MTLPPHLEDVAVFQIPGMRVLLQNRPPIPVGGRLAGALLAEESGWQPVVRVLDSLAQIVVSN